MKKNNRKGFTIVELVIVIAVIAILAAVMIPTFSGVVTEANESKALQEVKNAYTNTLAADLADGDPTGSAVYNKDIVVESNGILITISANGQVTVGGQNATYEVSGGKIVAKTP